MFWGSSFMRAPHMTEPSIFLVYSRHMTILTCCFMMRFPTNRTCPLGPPASCWRAWPTCFRVWAREFGFICTGVAEHDHLRALPHRSAQCRRRGTNARIANYGAVLLVSLATFASTLVGGLFALHLRDRLHLILGFSGGAVLGVVLFDLIPEAISLTGVRFGVPTTTAMLAAGFLTYMVLDRAIVLHGNQKAGTERTARRGVLGAGSLCVHSFLDGFSIGLAFKVSASVGSLVAVAVLVHDFSDGLNTVGLILKNRGSDRNAFRWLVVDAAAPIVGAASTLVITLQGAMLGLGLAAFAGFFLYIGASDLVPESFHEHPKGLTTAMTILGALTIFMAIRLVNG